MQGHIASSVSRSRSSMLANRRTAYVEQKTVPEPEQPIGIAPLKVLHRTDGKWIVYDPRRELGERTVWVAPSLELAVVAAKQALGLDDLA